MDERPYPEGYKPTETNSTRLQNCKIPSHYRHVASVGIREGARLRATVESRRNKAADISTLLDGNLCYARQRSAALRGSGGIADYEYPRLVRYFRKGPNQEPAGMAIMETKGAQNRRGCNPRRPQHGR